MASLSAKNKAIIITVAIVAIIVEMVCCIRWRAWFGNPTEPDYTPCDSICRVQLTFGNSGQYSRAFSWQCGDSAVYSEVQILPNKSRDTLHIVANHRKIVTTGGVTICYWAFADTLKIGNYKYRIIAGEQHSKWYKFAVEPITDDFTFIYLGDVQDTLNGTLRTKLHQLQSKYLPNFWLFGGDVIERPHDQYWNEYFNMVSDFCTSIPVLAIAGNHEYIKGVNKHLDERFVCVFPYFRENWRRSLAVFTMNIGNAQLVLLDSNNDLWNLPVEKMWFRNNYRDSLHWHIVTLHHPVYSLRGKMNNWPVRHIFAKNFDEKFDLVLQGHEHAYARMLHNDTLPLYVVSQCSPKDYRIQFSDYQRYAVGKRFYQVVHVFGDTLQMQSYTLDDELYDCVTIVKRGENVEIIDDFENSPELLELVPERFRKSPEKCEAYRADMEVRRQR